MRSSKWPVVWKLFASLLLASCLLAGQARAAVVNVQHVVNTDGGAGVTGSSFSVAFSSTVGSGNLVVGALTYANNLGDKLTSVTDDKGNSYTIVSKIFDSVNSQYNAIFYLGNVTNAPKTITANYSASTQNWVRITLAEFSGVVTTSPLDVTTSQMSPGSTSTDGLSSGSVTTTAAGDLIYGAFFDNQGAATVLSSGTGFTTLDNSNTANLPCAHEFLVQGSAGVQAATFTESASSSGATLVAAFKATAGGGPVRHLRSMMGVGQ